MCNQKKPKAAIAFMLVLTLLLTGCAAAYADPDTANESPVTDNNLRADNFSNDDIQEKPGEDVDDSDKPTPQPGTDTPDQPSVEGYIQTLFPTKEITFMMEGMPEVILHVAGGREPVIGEDGTCKTPGFAMYYDPARYFMTEENGNIYIRPIPTPPRSRETVRYELGRQLEGLTDEEIERKIDERLAELEAFYASLPPSEIEIRYIPNVSPAADANAVRNEMLGSWKTVSEPVTMENGKGVYLNFSNGTNWDSACGDIKCISDGRGGTFRITCRYFLEAAEGNGVRFSKMVGTFTVIDPQAQNKA